VAEVAERARLPMACLAQPLPAGLPPLPQGWRTHVSRTTGMPYFSGPGGVCVADPAQVPGWIRDESGRSAGGGRGGGSASTASGSSPALPPGWVMELSRRTGRPYYMGPRGECAAELKDIPGMRL